MPDFFDGIVVERTPMRDLAHRMIEVLHAARIEAWMASKSGTDVFAMARRCSRPRGTSASPPRMPIGPAA
jgi:hypothetical protein